MCMYAGVFHPHMVWYIRKLWWGKKSKVKTKASKKSHFTGEEYRGKTTVVTKSDFLSYPL